MLGAGHPSGGGSLLNRSPSAASRRDVLAWLVLASALFLPGIGGRDLWNPDEPRYAEVAREMLASGEFLVPHLNGEVYGHKPPLQFWAIAAAAWLTNGGEVDELATRLPAAVAGIVAVVLIFRLGQRLFGRRAAWFAAAAFATGVKILWQARVGQIDMLLVALVLAAVWFWVRSRTEERPRLALLFWGFAGLATIAKGPVGLLPPLLGILALFAVERDRAGIRALRPGLGLLLYVAVILAWLVPAALRGGSEYLEQIAFRQTVTRYADPWHHFQPWYYYLGVVPADFFPWSVILPGALVAAWRERDPSPARSERARWGVRFALCWILATLAFFSLSPAKRSVYVLTMYPALALVVGAGLDRIASTWPAMRRWLVWPLAGLTVLLAAAAVALPGQAARRASELAPLGTGFVPALLVLVVALTLAAASAWWLARRGRVPAAVAALATGMGLVSIPAATFVLPRFDAIKSARALSERLLGEIRPGEPYAIYPRLDATFLFYTRRFVELPEGEEELRRYAAGDGRVWLIIRKRDAQTLEPPLPLVEVARDADERDGYLLLGPSDGLPPEARPTP